MIVGSVDWTPVLVAVIPAIPATIAAFRTGHIRKAIRTPSGDPIGHVVERAHETGIANNLLLRKQNGPTKPADAEQLREVAHEPIEVPADTQFVTSEEGS
jgi:hypothetical protein